jgi:hypothetical protein
MASPPSKSQEDGLISLHGQARRQLVLVLGHTACGAIRARIDDVVLGNLTGLLARIKPAIPETKFEGEKSSKNPAYVDAVARTNVKLAMENIRGRSPVLADLEKKGSIQITGAMYNLANGMVDFDLVRCRNTLYRRSCRLCGGDCPASGRALRSPNSLAPGTELERSGAPVRRLRPYAENNPDNPAFDRFQLKPVHVACLLT